MAASHQRFIKSKLSIEEVSKKCTLLGWTISVSTSERIIAKTSISLLSWGEKIEIHKQNDGYLVVSSCAMPLQIVDWGKNSSNVDKIQMALS
tara:strand:+ start:2901 stop:3176 length:276 start_codon:yes stop_codon:yes gene_type:complete